MGDFRQYRVSETLTIEEHRALTEGRTRPLTDPHMCTAGAKLLREVQAMLTSHTDCVAESLEALIADRQARGTADVQVRMGRGK